MRERERGKVKVVAALERRMSTNRKKDKGDEREKPEWVDTLEKKLMDPIEGQSDVVMKRIADMEVKLKTEIDGVKLEVKKSMQKIGEIEHKTKKLEKELQDNSKNLEDKLLLVESKMLELHLRFRGLPEEQGTFRDQIVILIAVFIEKKPR